MTEKDLIRALSASVEDVRLSSSAKARIREQMNGGQPMKHKWKVGLVLVVTLLLATAAAGAWSLSRGFLEKTAALQFESGYYDDWSLEEKRGFVDIMAEYGLLEGDEAKALRKRSEDDLDAWMAQRYGINGRTDTIGFMSIAEAEMGAMQSWPNETWVWYNDMELRMGRLSSPDGKICVTPGEEAVPPEQAVLAAREAVAAQGGPSASELASAKAYWTYETHFEDETHEFAKYYIRLELSEGHDIWCTVSRDGTVERVDGIRAEVEEVVPEAVPASGNAAANVSASESATGVWDVENPHYYAYLMIQSAYVDEHGLERSKEKLWPLEDKKAIADLQEPLVKEGILNNDWGLIPGELFQTIYGYGVPEGDVISQEEAIRIVEGALTETFGLSQKAADFYLGQERWVDYLIRNASDEGHPVWMITYWIMDHEGKRALGLKDKYRDICIHVDAVTGKVLDSELSEYNVSADPKVMAMRELLNTKGAPANWTDEEWNTYLPWPRE